jgi:hypothetical protein
MTAGIAMPATRARRPRIRPVPASVLVVVIVVVLAVSALPVSALPVSALPVSASPPASSGTSYLVRTFNLSPLAWQQLYPTLKKLPPVATDGPADADGVPMRRWSGRLYYSPTGIAMRANQRLAAYIETGDVAYLDVVVRWAAKLQQLTVSGSDALWLPFPYDNPEAHLTAPWYNALAQGSALALFSRLYRLLNDPGYLATADGLFRSFELLGPSTNPWVGHVDPQGYLWLEHYPGGYRGRVLNAHLYAIFGLRDYWQETHSKAARTVLEGAITTMRDNAWKYRRRGTWSWYNLVHRVANRQYHDMHIRQLRALAVASGDAYFSTLADGFAADYP